VFSGIDVRAAPAESVIAALTRLCNCVTGVPSDSFGAEAGSSLIVESPWAKEVLRELVSLGFAESREIRVTNRDVPRQSNSQFWIQRLVWALQLTLATLCGVVAGISLRYIPLVTVGPQIANSVASASTASAGIRPDVPASDPQPPAPLSDLPVSVTEAGDLSSKEVVMLFATLMRANRQAVVAEALDALTTQSITDVLDVVLDSGGKGGLEPGLIQAVLRVAPAKWGRRQECEALRQVASEQEDVDPLFVAWRSAPNLESALGAANTYLTKGANQKNKGIVESWRSRCRLEITYKNQRQGDRFAIQRDDGLGNIATLTSWIVGVELSPRVYRLPGGVSALSNLKVTFQPRPPAGFLSWLDGAVDSNGVKSTCDANVTDTRPCTCTFRDGERVVSITLKPVFEPWAHFGL